MTAQDVIQFLTCTPLWINEAALIFRPNKRNRLYDTTQAKFYTEVTVRVPETKTAKRSGKTYQGLQRRRLDLVVLVKPNYRAYELLTIGIEIKVSKHDLLNDNKMAAYAPYCHLSYLACPYNLVDHAVAKLQELPNFGLLLVTGDEGLISNPRHPPLFQPTEQHLKEIFSELLAKQFKENYTERKLQ